MTIHILPYIARSKGSQTLKFGQVKNITKKMFSSKNHAENEAGRLVLDLFLVLKKVLFEENAA